MEVPIGLDNPNYQPPGVLVGLGPTISPAKAREAVNTEFVIAFSYGQIKNHLRLTAITIFRHQKLSTRYQSRVRNGANTMIFFLCAVHGFKAPGDDENLPRVGEDQMLPLCHWESLYLALVAEIRELYSDIKLNFKTELQNGDYVLHMGGYDGNEENQPFTAFELGAQLEEVWDIINDTRLVGPLESAVRLENATEVYRAEFGNATFRQRFEEEYHRLDRKTTESRLDTVRGMVDPDAYTAAAITDMLWQKYASLMNRACREKLHIELDLAARRAVLRETNDPTSQAAQEEVQVEPFCLCDEHCHCKLACQFEVGTCACKNKRLVEAAYNARHTQPPASMASIHRRPLLQSQESFGRVTDSMSNLQMSPSYDPELESVEAYKLASRTARVGSQTTQSFHRRRERSDTENSNLAYVPSSVLRTPTRGKNNIPLGMLGDESGQRYPTFRKASTDYPDFGSINYTTDMPQRKAVPFQSASGFSPSKRSKTTSPEFTLTMSSRPGPDPRLPEHRPSKSFLPQFLKLKGRSSSQKSPEPIEEEHPRKPDNEFKEWDTSKVKTPKISAQRKLGGEAIARHPSPMGRHSADSPVRTNRSPVPTAITRANTADSSLLALPDFMNPRPARRQRYVSAGGDTPLQDREEITDFMLPPAADPGFSMTKEELDRRVAQGEFITPPRASVNSSIPRASQESAIGSSGSGSGRPSYDTTNNQGNPEKRDRTASNISNRALKRIFSRTHSSSE